MHRDAQKGLDPVRARIPQQGGELALEIGNVFVGRHTRTARPDIFERAKTLIVVEVEIGDHLFADRKGSAVGRRRRQHPLEPLAVRHRGREQRRFLVDGLVDLGSHPLRDLHDRSGRQFGSGEAFHLGMAEGFDPNLAGTIDHDLNDVGILKPAPDRLARLPEIR